jgi:hypothetical protein
MIRRGGAAEDALLMFDLGFNKKGTIPVRRKSLVSTG